MFIKLGGNHGQILNQNVLFISTNKAIGENKFGINDGVDSIHNIPLKCLLWNILSANGNTTCQITQFP